MTKHPCLDLSNTLSPWDIGGPCRLLGWKIELVVLKLDICGLKLRSRLTCSTHDQLKFRLIQCRLFGIGINIGVGVGICVALTHRDFVWFRCNCQRTRSLIGKSDVVKKNIGHGETFYELNNLVAFGSVASSHTFGKRWTVFLTFKSYCSDIKFVHLRSRGNGVMHSALACYAGGQGSIPAIGNKKLPIQNVSSPSRV